MDYLQAELLYKLYREEGKSVDEKLKEMERVFTALEGQDNYVYQEDLKTLFSGELPVIEGVKVSTEMKGQVYSYIAVTKMPEKISAEVQKAFMRICGCLGGFTYEKWGIGQPEETTAIKEHFNQYFKDHPEKTFIPGKDAGYPKAVTMYCKEVDGAANESYTVTEYIGVVLD